MEKKEIIMVLAIGLVFLVALCIKSYVADPIYAKAKIKKMANSALK